MSAPASSEDLALADSQQVAFAALDRHVFNGILTPQQYVHAWCFGLLCGCRRCGPWTAYFRYVPDPRRVASGSLRPPCPGTGLSSSRGRTCLILQCLCVCFSCAACVSSWLSTAGSRC
jgi:hypothetical protein